MPGKNGIPSSTEVLNPWSDFSMINPAVLAHACQRGTNVHNAIAADLQGLWVLPLTDEEQGYFDSWRRWADLMIDKPVLIEKEIVCDCYGYMGHPDFVGYLKEDSRLAVIDWKTPIAEMKSWKGQAASYSHLAEHATGEKVERIGSVRLAATGAIARMTDYSDRMAEYFAAFLGALTAHKYFA